MSYIAPPASSPLPPLDAPAALNAVAVPVPVPVPVPTPASEPATGMLTVRPGGPTHRVLRTLVTSRLESPGTIVHVDTLFAAGWPGDRSPTACLANRLYVVLCRARQQVLGRILIQAGRGYMLDANVTVRLVPMKPSRCFLAVLPSATGSFLAVNPGLLELP